MAEEKSILITDYAWPSLDFERESFARIGARLLVAKEGSPEELLRMSPDADAILCNWKPVTSQMLHAATHCLTVGRYGIGLDNIDISAATSLGIVVTNVPAYCIEDSADHALALLLACNRKVCWFDRDIKDGRYDLQARTPLRRLKGKTLGIAGFGKIGHAVARRALAFGLRVIALKPRSANTEREGEVEFVSLPELLGQSDYISVHLPATPETVQIFDGKAFSQMKDGVVLINTSRGSLLPPRDLLPALESGKVAAAGIDVWVTEPLPPGDPLANHPNVIATPHSAFYSSESISELQDTAVRQAVDVLSGRRPENIVNPEVMSSSRLRLKL